MNALIIPADDPGYGNPNMKTPHIDRLAQSDVRLSPVEANNCPLEHTQWTP